MTDCNQKQIRDAIYGIISGRYVGRPRNKYTCIANRERGKRKRKTEGDRKREREGESTDELAWKRWTALAATSEVGPKCKAANLIRRLAEGSVASGPVASRGTMWHADSRQLYIINSHKYANPPVEAFVEVRRLRPSRRERLPRGFAASLSELSPRKSPVEGSRNGADDTPAL